jgi:hypothetical protein
VILLFYHTEESKSNEDIDRIKEFLLNSDYIKEINGSFPYLPQSTKVEE